MGTSRGLPRSPVRQGPLLALPLRASIAFLSYAVCTGCIDLLDLKRLSHIVALADAGNFVRAAEKVNLSQPALTRSIQAAEVEFGVRLFNRGSEITPTPAGEFVLEKARQLVLDARS